MYLIQIKTFFLLFSACYYKINDLNGEILCRLCYRRYSISWKGITSWIKLTLYHGKAVLFHITILRDYYALNAK